MHALNIRTEKSKNPPLHQRREKPNRTRIQISQTVDCPIPIKWIGILGRSVLREESWQGNRILSIVLVNDAEIQGLNARFLGKERPTDVIAFPLDDEEDDIWGEIYISVDRIEEQAEVYHVSFPEELARLVIHGILHLLGYKDHTKSDREKMKEKEDHHLSRFLKSRFPDSRMEQL